jgi:hypothetical protein
MHNSWQRRVCMLGAAKKPEDYDDVAVAKSFWDGIASRLLLLLVAIVLLQVIGTGFLPPESAAHVFPRNMFDVGVDSGIIMGAFLIIEGWFTRRGEIASGCFFVAGFIMLAEAGYLIYADYFVRTQR